MVRLGPDRELAVFERGGRTWEIFGAYDDAYFLDAKTDQRILLMARAR